MEFDPPLSGAYIRGLVKQLSTPRTNDSINRENPDCAVHGDLSPPPNSTKKGKVLDAQHAQKSTQRHQQQHKRQVRRRLQTTRPYQERLLNMAEARREIVTALKFHRASMKQATEQQKHRQEAINEQQHRPPVSLHPVHVQYPSSEQDGRIKSRRNPRIYPSCTNNFSNCMDDFSCSSFSGPPSPVPNPLNWPSASPVVPPLIAENPICNLPNQTLGLNLNFHDFNSLDATPYLNNNSSSSYSYSSPSSSSPPLSGSTDTPSTAISQGDGTSALVDAIDSIATTQVTGGVHTAMDDEGMAEIRSLGEQYQMEWNDTMNLVTSARWFKFLKKMEHRANEAKAEDDAAHPIFDELIEFPDWLNANDESCLEQCSEDYFLDPTLPCMDIGDIEGMDEEWLP